MLESLLFTFAGVAVDIVPHHGGCWLWPDSELCFHTVERDISNIRRDTSLIPRPHPHNGKGSGDI